jgi:glucosamine-6-phosphate deaminase
MDAPPAPLVLADRERVGAVAAQLVLNRLLARPQARLGFEVGRAPEPMFAALRAHAAAGELPSEQATVFALEAHIGPERLSHELRGIRFGALHTLDEVAASLEHALAGGAPGSDLEATAERHAALVEDAPLDLAVVELDPHGAIALVAPPASHASGMLVAELGVIRGLTVGLGTLYHARELIVLAAGEDTAPALQKVLEGPPEPSSPASLLRDHPRITVICDRAAASRLTPQLGYASDQVLIVLGHREPGSAEHRISFESRARLRHARRLAQRHPYRAAILTGYTSTGGLSEAEQMKGAWDEHAAPALLEVAGRSTAENGSRSLPIVLALGDIRRVVVVTSGWHLRTPFFFWPYRRYGIEVALRVSLVNGSWPRMMAKELRYMLDAPRQRRAAMAAMIAPR